MRYLLSLFLTALVFTSSAQDQRIGDTTATGIVTYSLRAINGKGVGNRTAVFDSTGKLVPGTGSISGGWGLTGNTGTNATSSFIGTSDAQPFILKANNQEGIRIVSSGQVAIGTTTATSFGDGDYRLFVFGGVKAKKVKVDQAPNNWADYVFADDYRLYSLKEVEEFIKKHKHLPDVPSAKEVGANGLDLGDNQAILLRKIEELTLYAIEQEKKVEEQARRNKELEERLEKLEGKLSKR